MIKLISHRGNINGVNTERENEQTYLQEAIEAGYDVELDIRRLNHTLWFGHDGPTHMASMAWLLNYKNNLWIHTKNFDAMDFLIEHNFRVFYHQIEDHVVIGNTRIIWSRAISEASTRSMIPLLSMDDINQVDIKSLNVYAICSDFVQTIKERL
jgi:hypothetical protein